MQIQRTLDADIVDGVRRMHAVARDARRGGAIDGAVAALGAALARANSTDWAIRTRCSASCRAACTTTCAMHRSPALDRHRLRRLRDRRLVGGRAEGGNAARARRTRRAAPARRPAALPDGRWHAGGPRRRRARRHRHVRLRAADAQRAQRLAVHALRRRQDPERAPHDRYRARSTRPAAAMPAAISRAAICTTCSASTRSWARGSRPIHNLFYYHALMAELRDAIAADALPAYVARFRTERPAC